MNISDNLEGRVQPYSSNIIFMDGEFTGLYPNGTEFLSIALIKPSGNELYLELSEYDALKVNDWVQRNVLPQLSGYKVSKEEARKNILKFVGDQKPYLIADVNDFDWMGICGLLGVYEQPFNYIPVDFATILFANGVDPDVDRMELAKSLGINVSGYKQHHALDDARVLKLMYEKLVCQTQPPE